MFCLIWWIDTVAAQLITGTCHFMSTKSVLRPGTSPCIVYPFHRIATYLFLSVSGALCTLTSRMVLVLLGLGCCCRYLFLPRAICSLKCSTALVLLLLLSGGQGFTDSGEHVAYPELR